MVVTKIIPEDLMLLITCRLTPGTYGWTVSSDEKQDATRFTSNQGWVKPNFSKFKIRFKV